MTWAARYSRTEQPELTIWRGGVLYERDDIEVCQRWMRLQERFDPMPMAELYADIAARVPVTECEEPGCVNWAMPDGRCHHLHGGSDEL